MSDTGDKIIKQSAESFLPGFKKSMGFLGIFFGDNDKAFQEALAEEYQDLTLELQKRLNELEEELRRQGIELEELKASQQASVIEEFLAQYIHTVGEEKRKALFNATVNQFDPRRGKFSARRYWWDQISQLSDEQIHVLQHLGQGPLFTIGQDGMIYEGIRGHMTNICSTPIFSDSDGFAIFATLNSLVINRSPFILRTGAGKLNDKSMPRYVLTPVGFALWEAMQLTPPKEINDS